MNRIFENKIYHHFKGKYYLVEGLANDSETGNYMVIYRALYGLNQLWVRPLSMFQEELPEDKQNEYGQKYRFEIVDDFGKEGDK